VRNFGLSSFENPGAFALPSSEEVFTAMASTVWKGHLTFGLVSLPVRLFSAARSESVSFNQLHRTDHSRVRQVLYCQAEDRPIERSEIIKGYEYEKGRYVVIEDEDVRKMQPKTAKVMEILEFVKSDQVDPLYFESSYYMSPEEAGEKPYALLFDALKRTGYVGFAKVTMHNREHIVILRPGREASSCTRCTMRTRSAPWRSFAPTSVSLRRKRSHWPPV
jgi:DNA end-binding protein Ku